LLIAFYWLRTYSAAYLKLINKLA